MSVSVWYSATCMYFSNIVLRSAAPKKEDTKLTAVTQVKSLTDFQTSFTDRFISKLAVKTVIKDPTTP